MAAKTPLTTTTTAGYVNPKSGLYTCGPSRALATVATVTNNLKTDVADSMLNRSGLQLSIFFFTDIDAAGDTWTSGIPGIKAVAWQPADATDDVVSPALTTVATGVISFIATNANSEGWLWVLHSS